MMKCTPADTRLMRDEMQKTEPYLWLWVVEFINIFNRCESKRPIDIRHEWEYYGGRPSALSPILFKCRYCDSIYELWDGHRYYYTWKGKTELTGQTRMPTCDLDGIIKSIIE